MSREQSPSGAAHKLAGVDQEIAACRKVLITTPEDDQRSLPQQYNNLGTLYERRFTISESVDDIVEAINFQGRLLQTLANSGSPTSDTLEKLADLHLQRYHRMGDIEDIDKAVKLFDDAVSATPATDINLHKKYTRLGEALHHRFEYLGKAADSIRSIECHNKAAKLVAINSPTTLQGTSETRSRATIDNTMSIDDIMKHLVAHKRLGDVYLGYLSDGIEVAVKTLRELHGGTKNENLLKRAAKELFVWSKCDHKNVQPLFGVVKFENQIAMVSPWTRLGNLRHVLGNDNQLDRCSMCAQIADGLVHLHALDIVHGDLKTDNVLVSVKHTTRQDGSIEEEYVPKLTDFGNARLKEFSLAFATTTSPGNLSTPYTAPEVIQGAKHTVESDVYSLGMTFFEILTGSVPFQGSGMNDVQLMFAVVRGKRPLRSKLYSKSDSQSNAAWTLVNTCWQEEPGERPTAIDARNESSHQL
ncbi:Ephrin type-A receptor 4 [Ceratobasidium sp. AG-Ba]|nr:Ephrin type-A receptor 4 [Ceratobasidium sp. AG-Ba]